MEGEEEGEEDVVREEVTKETYARLILRDGVDVDVHVYFACGDECMVLRRPAEWVRRHAGALDTWKWCDQEKLGTIITRQVDIISVRLPRACPPAWRLYCGYLSIDPDICSYEMHSSFSKFIRIVARVPNMSAFIIK